jgi:hypothetical protein
LSIPKLNLGGLMSDREYGLDNDSTPFSKAMTKISNGSKSARGLSRTKTLD